MSVGHDADSNSGSFSALAVGISWNHSTTSADVAIVHCTLINTTSDGAPTCHWGTTGGTGGTTMHEIAGGASTFNSGGIFAHASLFFVTASDCTISGTQQVTVNWSNNGFGSVGASTWLGGDQTTPLNNPQLEGSGAANSNLTVTSATGNQVVDAFAAQNGAVNFTQNKTSIYKVGAGQCGAAQRDAGAASVTMNMTFAASQHAHIAAQIKVAAAGGISMAAAEMHYRRMRS